MASSIDILAAIIFVAVFALLVLAQSVWGRPRKSYARRSYRGAQVHYLNQNASPSRLPDAADQLRAVENAKFGSKPLLRFQESKVFAAAQAAVRDAGMSWHVFAQVSLGEVLTCADREGFNAINAKRVDLLITDARFTPLAAVEYQGAGHFISKAAARDAVKKEALRRAGIGYIEINHDHGPEDVRREIERLITTRSAHDRGSPKSATG